MARMTKGCAANPTRSRSNNREKLQEAGRKWVFMAPSVASLAQKT